VRRSLPLRTLIALPFFVAVMATPARAGNLYVLGFTLDQQPTGKYTVDAYNWCCEEIDKVFREQAKSFHRNIASRLIRGKQATHAAALSGLAWLQKSATRQDLVVIYLGAHGFTDQQNGWGIITIDKKTLWGHEIKTELARLPCHAIVFVETCTSGGFALPHKQDPPVPANVTAICACSWKQTTDNPLDMAVAEALYGRADFNKDGVVELDEMIRYIRLRYKEWWPAPKTTLGSNTPVMIKAKTVAGPLRLTKVSPHLVGVVHNGTWYSALNEGQKGKSYRVHMLGWSSTPGPYFLTNAVTREFISLPSDGRPLLVEQGGRWYPARKLQSQGAQTKVHYIGYNEVEVVSAQRIFYPFVGEVAPRFYPYVSSSGSPGSWWRLGPAGAWKDTIAGAVLNAKLYTIETSGCLYMTDLSNGVWVPVGKPDFAGTAAMFAAGDSLYTIEKDGSLRRISPQDGRWTRVGAAGGWKGTRAGTVLKGKLYTVNPGGSLCAANLSTGAVTHIGKAEFGNTVAMYAAGDSLYTIEKDGSLYRVNATNGRWARLGGQGEWQATQAGAVLMGTLYTVETSGSLYATTLTNGRWKQIGKPEFAGTIGMFAGGDKLFTIEKDGSLYGVSVK
jgi:hypothetical protein